jgi:hypothetical protein
MRGPTVPIDMFSWNCFPEKLLWEAKTVEKTETVDCTRARPFPLWLRFGRRRGSQPTVGMPSVAEAEPAEFAETAATLAPQIERFFWWGERGGGHAHPCLWSHRLASRPRAHVPATVAALTWGVVRFPLWQASWARVGRCVAQRRSIAFRPASVILMRTTSTVLPPAFVLSRFAVASPRADDARDHQTAGDRTVHPLQELRAFAAACLRLRAQARAAACLRLGAQARAAVVAARGRPITQLDRISERPPPGGLSPRGPYGETSRRAGCRKSARPFR